MKIEEFAQRIGLSVSTVSKALNGYADVSEATRERVLRSARRLGYSPNPLGRRLRQKSSDAIGFVLSPPQTGFAHPFFLNMLVGIDEGLRETDYHLIITTAHSLESELDTFTRLVEKQHVDAMIFSRTLRDDPRIAYLQKRRIPFATFGRSEGGKPFPYVDIDYAAAGREGVLRLFGRGHRRIALVNSPTYYMFGNLRRQGYEAAVRECGLAVDPDLYAEEDITEDGGVRGLQRVMRAVPAPTAVLCAHDLTAIGVMRALVAAGKRPGKDVAVIGSDDDPIGRYCDPPLTTFSAETRRAGRRIMELLLAAMQGTPAKSLQEVWPPKLIARASDGPA